MVTLAAMKSKPAVASACVGLFMVFIWLVNQNSLSALLEYRKTHLVAGEWWRLYTCNFVHYTFYHLAMNTAGVVIIGILFWPPARVKLLIWALAIIPFCVGAGVYLLDDNSITYRGFSGVLYGVLVMALILNFRSDRLIFGIALLCLAGKIIFEQSPWFDNHYMQVQLGSSIAVESHLFGVLSGITLCGFAALWPASGSRKAVS